MNKSMISVDWLQVFCLMTKSTKIELDGLVEGFYKGSNRFPDGNYKEYRLVLSENSSKAYKYIYSVTVQGFEVAIIQCSPRSSVLARNSVSIKFSNQVLYSSIYVLLVYDLCASLGLCIKGLTRLDLCYDCNEFYNHRSVKNFLDSIFTDKFTKDKQSLRRIGSEKMYSVSDKSTGYIVRDYVKWGSKESPVSLYIYNKTKELKESKDKPYIRKCWQLSGLDLKRDVWRVEISIKSRGLDLLSMSDGELLRLPVEFLESQNCVESLFYTFANKYARFAVDNGEKYKKDMKVIQIFEKSIKTSIRPLQYYTRACCGRSERQAANKLAEIAKTYKESDSGTSRAFMTCSKILTELANIYRTEHNTETQIDYLSGLLCIKTIDQEYEKMLYKMSELFSLKRESRGKDTVLNTRL